MRSMSYRVRSSQVRLGHAMIRSCHIWSGQCQVGACHFTSGQYKVRSGKLASGYGRTCQVRTGSDHDNVRAGNVRSRLGRLGQFKVRTNQITSRQDRPRTGQVMLDLF